VRADGASTSSGPKQEAARATPRNELTGFQAKTGTANMQQTVARFST